MWADLVSVQTADGLKLHGALHAAAENAPLAGEPPLAGDAALLLHGTGSNFYSASLWQDLIPRLNRAGLAVLAVNTRGHDMIVATHSHGSRRLIGAAYERVDECRYDIAAWLDWLAAQGYQRLVLIGHSLGGLKAIYSQAIEPHPRVVRLVGLSPPRLSCALFAASRQRALFQADLRQAEALVARGEEETLMPVTFPIPLSITAAGYLEKYGPDERYNLLSFVPQVTVPQLYTFGSVELPGIPFAGLPDALEALPPAQFEGHVVSRSVAVIAGADHIYSGCVNELSSRITRWLTALS